MTPTTRTPRKLHLELAWISPAGSAGGRRALGALDLPYTEVHTGTPRGDQIVLQADIYQRDLVPPEIIRHMGVYFRALPEPRSWLQARLYRLFDIPEHVEDLVDVTHTERHVEAPLGVPDTGSYFRRVEWPPGAIHRLVADPAARPAITPVTYVTYKRCWWYTQAVSVPAWLGYDYTPFALRKLRRALIEHVMVMFTEAPVEENDDIIWHPTPAPATRWEQVKAWAMRSLGLPDVTPRRGYQTTLTTRYTAWFAPNPNYSRPYGHFLGVYADGEMVASAFREEAMKESSEIDAALDAVAYVRHCEPAGNNPSARYVPTRELYPVAENDTKCYKDDHGYCDLCGE